MKTSVIAVRDMLSVLSVLGVEKRIGQVPGVESVTVNFAAGNATVRYDETRLNIADIKSAARQSGYELAGESLPKHMNEHMPARKRAVGPVLQAVAAVATTPGITMRTASMIAPVPVSAPAVLAVKGDEDHAASGTPPRIPPPAMAKAGRLDDPSVKNADEVASALGANLENGLTSQEASRRLSENGPNELRSAPRRPAWRRFLSHFHDPLVYLLLAAVAIALLAGVIEGLVGWPVDAIVIAIIVLLNGVLGYVKEAKAQDAVAALARMTAATSAVLRDG